jgi:hypothetical protein
MSILYIAYGSNMNLEQMATRCPAAKLVGQTILKNYRLIFRGYRDNAVATIEPLRGGKVPVLVWEITPTDEAALDFYEGFPILYRKNTLRITMQDNTMAKAMVYIMNDGKPRSKPNCHYYSIILEAYKAAGFDVEILKLAVRDSGGGHKR